MKMKIGILTFHCADNYGAVLQAYGLQEYLKSLGHEVYVLDYRPLYLTEQYNAFMWNWNPDNSIIRNILFFIRSIVVMPIRLLRRSRFASFRHKFIRTYPCNFDCESSCLDAYIFGSDQIWNPKITRGFDKIFFGYFPAAKNKKNISYAASVGSIDNIISKEKDFFSMLSRYTNISVREKSIADFINCRMRTASCSVVDPVLLVGKTAFTSIALKKRSNKEYLLVFKLASDESVIVNEIAGKIAKEKKLEIVELVSVESIRNLSVLATASPERFISLFRDASYVVTTSYHGTVFSILFEKDFNTVSLNNSIERMSYLLSVLGLEDRIIDMKKKNVASHKIDYGSINGRLHKMIMDSQSFIKEALL